MRFPLPGLLRRSAIAAAVLTGALALLPGHVGAQTPTSAPLVPITAGTLGTGLVSLSGFNSVAVTLNGVASGSAFSIYTCATFASTPTPAACQIAGTIFAGSGGQATGSVASPIATTAIAEVFAQNAANVGQTYEAVFNGGYVGLAGNIPSCAAGTIVVLVNGLPACSNGLTSLAGCTQIVYIGTSAVCVSSGVPGLGVPWWWYYLYGFSYAPTGLTYYTACVPGAGIVPVFINGTFVLESC